MYINIYYLIDSKRKNQGRTDLIDIIIGIVKNSVIDENEGTLSYWIEYWIGWKYYIKTTKI